MRNLSFLFLVTTLALTAADFDAGLAAYQRGDYAAALQEWRPLAEQGHAAAAFNMGLLYYEGQGVPQDYTQAVAWFTKAANQDYLKAEYDLGAMYGIGKGVKRDYVQAYKWLNRCASKGDAKCAAQRDLVGKKLNASQRATAERMSADIGPGKEER